MKPDTLNKLRLHREWLQTFRNPLIHEIAALEEAIAELEKAAHVRAEIKAVLTENAHLADGTDCTLARLKAIVPEWQAEFNASDNF
jgi:hypothetical protein